MLCISQSCFAVCGHMLIYVCFDCVQLNMLILYTYLSMFCVCVPQCLHVSLFPYLSECVHVLRVRVCFSPWLVAVGRISDRTRCSVKTFS